MKKTCFIDLLFSVSVCVENKKKKAFEFKHAVVSDVDGRRKKKHGLKVETITLAHFSIVTHTIWKLEIAVKI